MSDQLKVNFGCGGNVIEGWKNHDSDVPIEQPLPYADGEVDFILIEHCMEHVTHIEALGFLKEAYRILKSGGTLRVCIPVLTRLDRPQAEDIIKNHGHKAVWNERLLEDFLWVAGFSNFHATLRKDCDGHRREIGEEKDMLETCRYEAIK